MADRYEARYGDRWVKPQPTCLVWKESQAVTNLIRSSHVRLTTLVDEMSALRFLFPVRNPIDCAFSNVRTGHAERIPGADPTDAVDVLDKVIEMIAWFDRAGVDDLEHFFMYFQNDDPAAVATGLRRLLGLSEDEQWVRDVTAAFDVHGEQYSYETGVLDAFRAALDRHFPDGGPTAHRLAALVED